MLKIIEVNPLEEKKIFVKYSDGLEGVLNLKRLLDRKEYENIPKTISKESLKIDEESGDVILFGKILLCKVAMHEILRLRKQMEKLGIYLGDE